MTRKKKGDTPTEQEPLREDPESQPFKGGRRSQHAIPGVREHVQQFPDIDDAMKQLADDDDAMNDAKAAFEKQRDIVQGLLQKHKVPGLAYSAHGVMVGERHPETKLFVKRLKSPAKSKKSDAA